MADIPSGSVLPEKRSGVRYQLVHTICLREVASKFAAKERVSSEEVFCRHDPEHTAFKLHLDFGRLPDFLSPYILSIERDVVLTKLGFKLFDDKRGIMHAVSPCRRPSRHLLKKGEDSGTGAVYPRFYKSHDVSTATTWKVICELEYEAPLPRETPSPDDSCNSSLQAVQTDYLKLLESASNADVAFLVQEERIMAHKVILSARCDYFERMFTSETKENVSNEVKVPDVEPDVFRGMLQYLYAGAAPKNLADIALNLFIAADKYGLEKLKKMCESLVCANLSADNVVDVLLVAEKIDNEKLMSRAKVVFRGSFYTLMRSEDAKNKLSRNLLWELLSHSYDETP